MDGFAVVAADLSPWREVTGEQAAGPQIALEVSEGYAIKIMTGAPLPAGADAVVPIERVQVTEDHIVLNRGTPEPRPQHPTGRLGPGQRSTHPQSR